MDNKNEQRFMRLASIVINHRLCDQYKKMFILTTALLARGANSKVTHNLNQIGSTVHLMPCITL